MAGEDGENIVIARLIGVAQAIVIGAGVILFKETEHLQWAVFGTVLANAILTDAYARYARPCRWRGRRA